MLTPCAAPRTTRGLGLVTVMMVMGVISALAITATTLSISNLGDARRDRQALAALATGEAGVSARHRVPAHRQPRLPDLSGVQRRRLHRL